MTKKVKKEIGPDPDSGNMMYLDIWLTDAEELLYDLLLRIVEKVNA